MGLSVFFARVWCTYVESNTNKDLIYIQVQAIGKIGEWYLCYCLQGIK